MVQLWYGCSDDATVLLHLVLSDKWKVAAVPAVQSVLLTDNLSRERLRASKMVKFVIPGNS